MNSGALLILTPLLIGYLIPIKNKNLFKILNKLLGWLVYVILFLMGLSLSLLDDLSSNLKTVFYYASIFTFCITSANLIALHILHPSLRWHTKTSDQGSSSHMSMIFESLQLCGIVALGFLIGLTNLSIFHYAPDCSEIILLILLLLVGLQLRNSGMTPRQIFINKNGILIALVVAISSILAGGFAAFIIDLPIKSGMAIASGYGWYSLSGSVLTKSLGPVLGSVAFFNDLARELIAIMFIPALMKKNVTSAIGICGATSMDFTLPVLQKSGGIAIVPASIVHGFILSFLAPVFMATFS